ncbi:MAG TPA: TolC family protein, partial [Bdellovibrionales bacterium]|nr:TolC family protein [Bdellovibrionales bacterium]
YVTVAQSYYEVLAAEADLKNLQTSVELTEGRIKELQRRARIGRSRTGEVLTNQSSLALQKANVQDAIDRLARARQNFAFQTGMSPISLLQTPVIPANSASALPALENYVAKIPERSDVRSLEMRAQAASSSTDLARAGHMPTLNLIGNGYWTKDARDGETQWDVGLGLTIPIFEGGAVQGRVREAKSEEIEAQLNLQRQKRAAESEIAQIHASLTNTLRQITSLEEAVTSSEKNYKEQTRDYSYGLVNNLDVLQAQNTLQETRRSLDRSRFLSLVYWAELKAAVYDIPEVTR